MASAYNVVDTIFVGRLGVDAISALSIAFPFQLILLAIAAGTGVGVSSFISRSLGKKDKRSALKSAGNALVLAGIYGVFSLVIGLFFSEDLVRLFISDKQVVVYASSYIRIIFIGSVFYFYQIIANYVFRGQGNVILPMGVQIFSSIVNVVLDPIFIFGMFGFPALGVKGAAYATVAAMFSGSIVISLFLLSKKNELRINLKSLFLEWNIIKKIYKVGFPTAMLQFQSSISLIIINSILASLSLLGIAIYGIFFKIQMLVLMPIFGITQAFIPLVGYNFGAGNKKRVKEALKITMIVGFLITFSVFLILEIFPELIISVFSNNSELIEQGSSTFRIISIFFFLIGPGLILASFFQATGEGFKAYIIFGFREYLFLLPLFFIIGINMGLPEAWFAFPIADFLTVIIAGFISYRYFKKKLD